MGRDQDPSRLCDDSLFIVACDDTSAPKQYFSFFRFTRLRIHVVETMDGRSVAEAVLNRLLSYECAEHDERWMLLDTDHVTKGTHLSGFLAALKEAERQGVRVALSKPSFELWLLLHHEEETAVRSLGNSNDVERAILAKLGEYNKTNLKAEHYPPASGALACERARRLDETVDGGDVPQANTSRVYRLWDAIEQKTPPAQFPFELSPNAQVGLLKGKR